MNDEPTTLNRTDSASLAATREIRRRKRTLKVLIASLILPVAVGVLVLSREYSRPAFPESGGGMSKWELERALSVVRADISGRFVSSEEFVRELEAARAAQSGLLTRLESQGTDRERIVSELKSAGVKLDGLEEEIDALRRQLATAPTPDDIRAIVERMEIASRGLTERLIALEKAKSDTPPVPPEPLPPPPMAYTILEAQVKEHLLKKSTVALRSDIEQISKAIEVEPESNNKTLLGTLIGMIVNGTTDDDTQNVAIVAIGNTRDPALFRYVRRFLSQPNPDVEPPLCKTAIEASAKLESDAAVMPLLTIVDKSRVLGLSAAAMTAFERYGTHKSVRGKILRDLVNTVAKDRPGGGRRWESTAGDPREPVDLPYPHEFSHQRWGQLSGTLVATLNAMTGAQVSSSEEWFNLVYENRSGLDRLFVDPKK